MSQSSHAHRQRNANATTPQSTSANRTLVMPTADNAVDFSLRATWKSDLAAGLVVFLVALPLCLGVALASGAPLLAGVITGIVGGLIVSRFSGSSLMVSGPAAGLTAIVLTSITKLGSFEIFLVAVVIAGAMQVLLGVLRAGIIGYYFPSSVIRGMLAAIGLTLILKQLPYAFGAGIEPFESDAFAQPHGGNTLTAIVDAARAAHPAAVALTIAALIVLVGWPKVAPKKLAQLMPAPLAAVIVGVVGSLILTAVAPASAIAREAHVSLPIVSSAAQLFGMLRFPDWSALARPEIWQIAATIAIVASLETLLSVEATDKLDPWKRTSPTNRELFAQGSGNILSGLLGGLPMTGVIVRSAANVSAGGRTWRSSWVHGLFLLIAVVALPVVLNRIPLAVLAAILIHTGFKLAHPKIFREAWRIGLKYALPFAITVFAILATDLLIGITIGLAVGAFFVLLDSWSHAYSYHLEESADHHRVRLVLAEEVTFLNKARINQALQALPPQSVVTVDASRTKHFDHDVIELLHDFHDTARGKGIVLRLIGVPEPTLPAAAH
ncbi:MAG TPA: SulP family inorganic anion transporter [Gemmatimonadaceae bacterium]|jgi:MFS superfamily sulfate permease-like transporter